MLQNSIAFSSYSTNKLLDTYLFYKDLLLLDADLVNDEFIHVNLPDGNIHAIYHKDDHEPTTFTVLNFQVQDVEDVVDKLEGRGIEFLHYSSKVHTNEKGIAKVNEGGLIAWFKDPGGNIISIVQN